MRTLLAVLLFATVVGCDSNPPEEEEPPGEQFIGVRVAYTVSFTGDAPSATIRYTDEEGEVVTDLADFTRMTEFTQEFELPAGSAGTFSLFAEGFVDTGALTATILVTRLDSEANVTSDTQTSIMTSGSQEVTVEATVTVEPEPLRSSI